MYTTAFVKTINTDGTVLVSCSCDSCQGCKAEMFCNNKDDNEYLVRNDNHLKLVEGQIVNLFLPPSKTIMATALVFALPLALFPVGYLAMKSFHRFNELICALGGIGAMAVAFAIMSIINIRHKNALMPVIVEDARE